MAYPVTDIPLAAFLKLKGYGIKETGSDGRMVTFFFDEEAEDIARKWSYEPDDEMKMIQNFVTEKERLFSVIKQERRGSYGGNYR